MRDLIQETITDQKVVNIIPVEGKGLKIPVDKISYSPSIGAYLLMLLICLLPTLFFFGFFNFLIMDAGGSIYSVLIISGLILYGLMALTKFIYMNKVENYPNAALVLTETSMHYFLFSHNEIINHADLEIDVHNLGAYFYGEMNSKTGRLGKRFKIKRKDTLLMSGNLSLKNNEFRTIDFEEEELFPIEELRKIYLT